MSLVHWENAQPDIHELQEASSKMEIARNIGAKYY